MGCCGSSSKRIEDLQDEKIQENQSITEIGIINLGQNDENNNTNHFFKINVLEIIIAIILFIGLVFGIYKLYKHWKQKRINSRLAKTTRFQDAVRLAIGGNNPQIQLLENQGQPRPQGLQQQQQQQYKMQTVNEQPPNYPDIKVDIPQYLE